MDLGFELIDVGQILFGSIGIYLLLSYRRKIAYLKTYIGMDQILHQTIKGTSNSYQNSYNALIEYISKDLNSNKNNLTTLILLIVCYLIVLNENIISMYIIMPIICLTIVLYFNNKYNKIFKSHF